MLTHARPATILFDLDGTLTDPAEGIVKSLEHAFATLGLACPDRSTLGAQIGPPLQDIFPDLGVPPDRTQEAIAAYRSRYATVGLFENVLYDGVTETLHALTRAGCVMAVATSKPWVFAERVLAHFDLSHFFAAVCGPELDGRLRNKHELVVAALDRLGRSADSAVMIGDRHYDVRGAAVHAIPTIGVLWGHGTRDELEAAGAWRLADHPSDLLGILFSESGP